MLQVISPVTFQRLATCPLHQALDFALAFSADLRQDADNVFLGQPHFPEHLPLMFHGGDPVVILTNAPRHVCQNVLFDLAVQPDQALWQRVQIFRFKHCSILMGRRHLQRSLPLQLLHLPRRIAYDIRISAALHC